MSLYNEKLRRTKRGVQVMPTSDGENKHKVLEWYESIMPKTVLDIGAGEGTYAKLIDNSDLADEAYWTAIEAWGPYVTKYKLGEIYNNVVIADACYVDYSKINLGYSDLTIAGDVLEHMTKTESKELIQELKKHSRNIIISVPLLHLHQDAYKGNWFEKHIDHWHFNEMKAELGKGVIDSVEGPTLGYFWWSSLE